jgi:hypothetical protein
MCPQSITDPAFQQVFLAKLLRVPSGCLEWQGYKNSKGYGRTTISRKSYRVHRVAWEIKYGPIPKGLDVLHRCDNPPCCDPEHLFLGTRADNAHDMIAKGRAMRGERNNQAKLTETDVLEIRRIYVRGSRKFGSCALGHYFGVTNSTIGGIIRREYWTHV